MPAVNILVINAGSSSLKFHFYEMPAERMICSGVAERIDGKSASLHYHSGDDTDTDTEIKTDEPINDHEAALKEIVKIITGIEKDNTFSKVDLIAHRVVHGGNEFANAAIITSGVKEKISELSLLAPLHNPVNLRCILLMERLFPGTKQVAVFDTAFHHQMPEVAIRYAIPEELYIKEHVRAYGFHGISHKYVTDQAREYLQKKDAKLISMHLGNGCSIAAVQGNRPVDTSMGFGPVSGLVMATRSGDIDPSAIIYIMEKRKMKPEEMDDILNKRSGLLALCGLTDMRDIKKEIDNGNNAAFFACELYAYRLRKYIGAYIAALNGLDALVFTGGVGENAGFIRELVCSSLESLNILFDKEMNRSQKNTLDEISQTGAKVKILVIPTNEELEIARQAYPMAGYQK